MLINIKPIGVLYSLLGIILFLTILDILGTVYIFNFFPGNMLYLIRWFDFDRELNIPTFFSTIILLLSSITLFFIGWSHKLIGDKYVLWILLSVIFLFLSFDETVSLHERQIRPFRDLFNASGYLYFAWVIPYSIFVFILGLVYIKFLFRLPKKIMILFILSGCIYISGAVGMELISGNHAERFGGNNIVYHLYTTLEELLEMIGISIFIYSLLSYISIQFRFLGINIKV